MSTVRASKYRHVYGQPFKKDKTFDNIRLTKNAFDSNLAKANGKYVSLCWNASGGGAFAVLPLSQLGKLPDRFPLFSGHRGAVLDTDWNPFDDSQVVSASDDGTIGIWKVPENFKVQLPAETTLDDVADVSPVRFLEGHEKKVGHVLFNPVAENILASSSIDYTIKVWDTVSGDVLYTLPHSDAVTSFAWNYDGTKIASVSRDKKIRIWDVRAEKLISEGASHTGSKASRIVWLGDRDRALTTGFSRLSDRQLAIWDTTDVSKGPIKGFKNLDQSSGIIIPYFDVGSSVVYLGGRGDGTIVYYEFADDGLHDLFSYQSTTPQRGLAFAPDNTLDIRSHEVARCYKVHETFVEPIPFLVPRKVEGFLSDIYTTALASEPALTAQQWASGKTARPLVISWRDVYDGKTVKATSRAAPASAPSPVPVSVKKEMKEDKSDPVSNKEDNIEKAVSPAVQAKSASPVPGTEKASKQDAGDALKSKDVSDFLAKSSEAEHEEPTVASTEKSSWDEEPEVVATTQSYAKSEPEEESKTSSKSDSKPESTPTPEVAKPAPDATSTPAKAPASDVTSAPPSNGTQTSPAKASINKLAALHDQVHKLTALVEKLHARVEELESK